MGKTSDIFNPKPIKDDLFGHGSSFNNEEPPPDLDKMWKNFNKKLNRLLHLKKRVKIMSQMMTHIIPKLMILEDFGLFYYC